MKIQTTAAFHESIQLVEQMRLATRPAQTMGGPGAPQQGASGIETAIKLLKFDDEALKTVFGGVGVALSGVGALVAAGLFAYDIYKKFFSDENKPILDGLKRLEAALNGLYDFEGSDQLRIQREKRTRWIAACDATQNALANFLNSPSSDHRTALATSLGDLSRAIAEMHADGDIPFQRKTYEANGTQGTAWIDAARPPWMATAGGGVVNIGPNLATQIWDAGWFMPTLLRALLLHLNALLIIEPAARSTFENRVELVTIYRSLSAFMDRWENSMLISNIPGWINRGGRMSSPFDASPIGIMIGAVDPTSGVTAVDYQWGWTDLQIEQGFDKGIMADGSPDWSVARNPDGGQQGVVRQVVMLHEVMRRSGYWELRKLEWRLRDLLSPFEGSTFVDIGNPVFEHRGFVERGEGDIRPTIDERLKRYYRPAADYRGQRFFQTPRKTFGFDAARRMEVSQIQLGYRIRIAGETIDLIDFSTAPIGGEPQPYFPTGTIQRVIERDADVVDCYQADHMTPAQEDDYERLGSVPAVPRALVNERPGRVSLDVAITMAFDPFGPMPNPCGRITVQIDARNPHQFKDAAVIPIIVEERRRIPTGPSDNGAAKRTEWVKADEMTVLIAPSYIVIDGGFFADLDRAWNAMLTDIKGINDKFSLKDLLAAGIPGPEPEPDPRWRNVAFDRRVQWGAAVLDAAQLAFPKELKADLLRHQKPAIRRD